MRKLTKKLKNIKLTYVIIFLLLLIIGYLITKNNDYSQSSSSQSTIVKNEKTKLGCNRSELLPNKPQFQRALSLINDTVKYAQQNPKGGFEFFDYGLINCLHVDVDDIEEEEGYFIFNDDRIKPNYYPITVDKSYLNYDDATIALLLTHELTHVQQYIDDFNGGEPLSCLDKEAEAFFAQLKVSWWLPQEDKKSIKLKIQYDENLNPQMKLLSLLNKIDESIISTYFEECPAVGDPECTWNRYTNKIKIILLEDDYYRKECNL